MGISGYKRRGTHTFGVHFTIQKTYKGCGRVGYSPDFSTDFKQKLVRSFPAQGQAIYLHGGWAGCWEGQGLDKCPGGWGSSHWCEGQNQNLSCGGRGGRDELVPVAVFLVPMPCSAGDNASWAGTGWGKGAGPGNSR